MNTILIKRCKRAIECHICGLHLNKGYKLIAIVDLASFTPGEK